MKYLAAALLLLASCGESSSDSPKNESKSKSDPTDPMSDFSQPYLSEKSLGNVIDSLNDPGNPYFDEGGTIKTVFHAQAKIEEFNAYARKQGFKDHVEYSSVLSRVMMGRAELLAREMADASVKQLEEQLKALEEEEKNSPDPARQQQIEALKTAIEQSKQAKLEENLNAKDLDLIRKRTADIDGSKSKREKK